LQEIRDNGEAAHHRPRGEKLLHRPRAELRRAGLGELFDDGSVQLDVAALHDLAEAGATLADWEAGWRPMIAYATGKGWVSADGRSVRAHVEPHSG
jgi:hypothetical protein